MSGLFSSPKGMQQLPADPKVDQAQLDRESDLIARRRRGRAATVIAGDQAPAQSSVAAKAVLGG
jgi:hypothetical protein